jgi:anti-sigma regulatory factor (Ser/Thr protein kinase)
VGLTDDQVRVRFERGIRWILDRYRSETARELINKARSVAAHLLMPPTPASPSVPSREPAARVRHEEGPPDVLAGLCGGVALRDLNLVDSLLAELEGMEANEGDPDALARLYQLDHLAARLRRNAENLRVLAGHDAGSTASGPSPLVDVIRAAMSSIEQYPRIDIKHVVALAVVDFAADDLSRLLAELLDNATSYSAPASKVTVGAHATEQGGVLVRIEDAGIGLPEHRLQALNDRLSVAPKLDSGFIEQMGLAVVRRLAVKHDIRVRLEKRATHGTVAVVLMPAGLVCDVPAAPWFAEMSSARPAPSPTGVQASPLPTPRSSSEWSQEAATSLVPRTTRNGLPRRVPQSIREFAISASTVSSSPYEPGEAREQLMTDLGDFSEGEPAARDGRGADLGGGDRAEGSPQ